MSDMVRINLLISPELAEWLKNYAEEAGVSQTAVLRLAFALQKVALDAKKRGLHIGLVDDPCKLDTELVGIL